VDPCVGFRTIFALAVRVVVVILAPSIVLHQFNLSDIFGLSGNTSAHLFHESLSWHHCWSLAVKVAFIQQALIHLVDHHFQSWSLANFASHSVVQAILVCQLLIVGL